MFNTNRDKVVLVHKLKPQWQKDKLNGVGGKIEDGETPMDAMIREFAEETGVYTQRHEWQELLVMGGHSWSNTCFKAFCDYQVFSREKEQVKWYNLEDLKHLPIIENLNWLIPLFLYNNNIQVGVHYV